jgi:hypothetical protein
MYEISYGNVAQGSISRMLDSLENVLSLCQDKWQKLVFYTLVITCRQPRTWLVAIRYGKCLILSLV